MKIHDNTDEPKVNGYILGNQNHVGFYFNGYVYYFGKAAPEKNKQLSQLLKECKEYLSDVDTYFTKIEEQQAEIDRLREAIRLARDTAYQSTQDCPLCGFIDDLLTKTLNEESEGK